MKRMMSWTPTRSHLMKQMPRKRGPRHKGLESTKWNDEISYLGSEKLMSFWAIFLVLHFASLICGNPLFGCYKGGNIRMFEPSKMVDLPTKISDYMGLNHYKW